MNLDESRNENAFVAISKTIFKVPDSYCNQVKQFGKIDALLAMILFLLYCVDMALAGILSQYVSVSQITYIGGLTNLLFVGIVLLMLKVRKQGLDTIGLRKGNIKLSLIMGIFLAFILFFCNCLSNIWFAQQTFIATKEIAVYILYFFTVGLVEEVMFRGYIETRLHGFTGRICLDVTLTGILFLLMHFPFRMVAYHMSFWHLITNASYMMDLFMTHLVLSFIRIRSDSLYGAIIPHWISDLAYRIVTHG